MDKTGMTSYAEFLEMKYGERNRDGFKQIVENPLLFDFQQALTKWAIESGRSAIFADCGTGKTAIQLVWAENVVHHTNKPVLILTPLAVSGQTVREGKKFGIECTKVVGGKVSPGINVTNYERLDHLSASDFSAVVCDESSCLKSFDSIRRKEITEFMKRVKYRLLCTATAAPNDYVELGTSSEALGQLGFMDMLARFFKNDQNTSKPVRRWTAQKTGWASQSAGAGRGVWRFKGHAEEPFWRWVCSWARALRKPSDLGFEDGKFILPPLIEQQHVVKANRLADGQLFAMPAVGLSEQREERRRTLQERCEKVAELVSHDSQALVWCGLNPEGDLLESLIADSVQISGADSDEKKEEAFLAFAEGKIRVIVTKAVIGGWGLNFQNCSHVTFFPSHSFEQYYQAVRRCWRFGQKNPVTVDIITTEGEQAVMENLQRKAKAADRMFERLVSLMREHLNIDSSVDFPEQEEVPAWL